MKLKRNMCRWDQALRVIVGAAMIYLAIPQIGLIHDPVLEVLLGIIGVINFLSGTFAHCPLYRYTGLSTCQPPPPPRDQA